MIHRSVTEWGYVPIEPEGEGAFTRRRADRLIAVARAALGGDDGTGILTDHHKRLRAQQVVGVIAAEGCTLEILPKIEGLGTGEDEASRTRIREQLIHMLAVAYDLDLAIGEATPLGTQKRTLLEVLIGIFCARLTDVLRNGMPRRYVHHEEDLPALRGRLDVQRQFTTLAATPNKLACRYEAFSADIALNQVMKAAVTRLSQVAQSPANQRRLRELAHIYADIAAVPVKALRWDVIVLDRTNHRWRALRDLARLLLAGEYQTTSHGKAPGFSLLFAMNDLFEAYVARVLARALRHTDLRVVAQDRRLYCLAEPSGARRFQVRPDIVVRRGQETVMVIDTKWKRISARIDDPKQGVSQADVYQMMAYGRLYRCPSLMLLYPHHGGLRAEGETGRYRVSGCNDELVTATVDLAASGIAHRLRSLCEVQLRAEAE
ncbi:McrC family protein [Sphingomonas sp. Root241]|uniref:McrC family protein n=1 Tax=Sphingomonas sp. Root241 TaxID=1736501 RepID=UPI00070209C7|nr:restriction endonuclease [Sphingomonas sp. Root241]KRC81305.1 restriction endonuclease [Sphingomonas sp. Root241]